MTAASTSSLSAATTATRLSTLPVIGCVDVSVSRYRRPSGSMAPASTTPSPCFTASSVAACASKLSGALTPSTRGTSLRANAVTKLAVSIESLRIGSSVWSNVASPVALSKSAITAVTGSCSTGGGGGRKYHHAPPMATSATAAAASTRGKPDGALHGQRHAVLVQARERFRELGRGLEPLRRIGLCAADDERVESGGHGGCALAQCARRRAAALLELGLDIREPSKPRRPGEHVVDDEPERVNVRALIDDPTERLLGRHVLDRADRRADARQCAVPRPQCPGWRDGLCFVSVRFACVALGHPSDAEVRDQGLVVTADHDVRGLEIAMHDTSRVRRDEAVAYLPCDPQRAWHVEGAVTREQAGEVRAVDVRHRDVFAAVDLAEIVNSHDIGVRHEPREQQLALEPAFDSLPRRPASPRARGESA